MRSFKLRFFEGMTTANSPTEIRDYYDRVALAKALPAMPFRRWGQKRPIPKGNGKTITFTRWGLLAPATTPLSEGVTPVGNTLSHEEIRATLNQYGDWVPLTDQVQDLAITAVLTEVVESLGEQEAETLSVLTRNSLMMGTNVSYAGGVTARDAVVAKATARDYDAIVRKLKVKNAKPITSMVAPTVKYSTQPLAASYIGIVHPATETDLRGLEKFVPVQNYASNITVMDNEIGSYGGIRFVASTLATVYEDGGGAKADGILSTSGSRADVYTDLIFAKDAYGETMLGGDKTHGVIIKVHGSGDTNDVSDPLNQRGTAGWKAYYAAKILNDDWLVRFEHAVSE